MLKMLFKPSRKASQSWFSTLISESVNRSSMACDSGQSCGYAKIATGLWGLLFLAVGDEIGSLFGLPWLQDIHTHPALVAENPILGKLITDDLQYDSRSAFTLSLNHRKPTQELPIGTVP